MTPTRIGGVYVFTREGATNAYKSFSRECHKDLTPESAQALFEVGVQMTKLGFTWDELDEIDFEVIKEGELA